MGVNWRIGVSVSSSDRASLRTPFVTVVLSLRNAQGVLFNRSVELSVNDFEDFHQVVSQMVSRFQDK